jgi:hypothetical protein
VLVQRRLVWLGLGLLGIATIAAVIVPIVLVQPFRAQSDGELQLSYWLRLLSPWLTVLALAVLGAGAAGLWGGARWYGRTALVLAALPLAGGAWLSRQNHFEWMFAPLAAPRFAAARDDGALGPSDAVLAVRLNGEAAAYPVRQLAYHHVVMDVVGGVPIAVTY